MSKSTATFQRWISREPTSWPFRVFNKYSGELSYMYITHITSHAYIYNNLGKTAKWNDPADKHFTFIDPVHQKTFKDIKDWSESYNEFDNWINLNAIMAISSNLETYLSKTIRLALESDVGTIFDASRRIDGVEILKYSSIGALDFDDKIVACTKGDWPSRVSAFQKLFGAAPSLLTDNISSLEKLRKLRNNVGHAFGREIEEMRKHDTIQVTKSARISRERTIKYMKLIYGIAKEIDKQLVINHIGEYQTVLFYHNLRKTLKQNDSIEARQLGNHVAVLKRKVGMFGVSSIGKKFCKELIQYYEAL